ncbi:MAG: HEAT repeat domain-containing protein [Zavarzinella sp.]
MSDLAALLQSDNQRDVQRAYNEIRKLSKSHGIRSLYSLLSNSMAVVRCNAIEGICDIFPHEAAAVLLYSLNDSDAAVRITAIDWIYRLSYTPASNLLGLLAINDLEELVRSWALLALGRVGDIECISILEFAAKNDKGVDHEGRMNSDLAMRSKHQIEARSGIE